APGAIASLQPGDLVELITDPLTLGGAAAKLFEVASIASANQIELDRALPAGVTAAPHPFLRRRGTDGPDAWCASIKPVAWVELEDGIGVCFGPGAYRRGANWWIPARRQPT